MSSFLYQQVKNISLSSLIPRYRRMFVPLLVAICLLNIPTRELTLSVLADAFWQVSVFVAATLAVYHLFSNKILSFSKLAGVNKGSFWEVTFACLLGCLPGCGGAIIVITRFINGSVSFGAVVAVLTSTMGDAAFLLLVREPTTALGVIALCLVVGVLTGSLVNRIHHAEFLKSSQSNKLLTAQGCCYANEKADIPKRVEWQGRLWGFFILPSVVVAFAIAAQVDIPALTGISEQWLTNLGAIIGFSFICLWAMTKEVTNFESVVAEDNKAKLNKAFQKVALDTNFVTSWVVVAFLLFELVMLYSQLDLAMVFNRFQGFTPFIAVLIGMIPGCGPQIITTTLYLSGAIPLSAQIGNAISNDGDALFPAIALSPKVALVATLYSAIPALICAYGYFWIFEQN